MLASNEAHVEAIAAKPGSYGGLRQAGVRIRIIHLIDRAGIDAQTVSDRAFRRVPGGIVVRRVITRKGAKVTFRGQYHPFPKEV